MNIEELKTTDKLNLVFFEMINSNFNEDFVKEFMNFAPEIAGDILSASLDDNPDCECRKKISLYVKLYNIKCAKFLYDFGFKNDILDSIEVVLNECIKIDNENISLSGKIAKTNINEWENFVKEISKKRFNLFSVVKDGDDLLVFFV